MPGTKNPSVEILSSAFGVTWIMSGSRILILLRRKAQRGRIYFTVFPKRRRVVYQRAFSVNESRFSLGRDRAFRYCPATCGKIARCHASDIPRMTCLVRNRGIWSAPAVDRQQFPQLSFWTSHFRTPSTETLRYLWTSVFGLGTMFLQRTTYNGYLSDVH